MTTHSTTTDTATTALTSFDADFGGGSGDDFVVKPTLMTNPRLQWMTGKLKTTNLETTVGWHIEADVNPQLDEILSMMGMKRYIVRHEGTGQNGEDKLVPYWALNDGGSVCSLFVIAYGVKSSYEMNRDVQDRYGVAYGWEVVKDRQGAIVTKKNSTEPKRQCRVQFRAFIQELVERGFTDWFQVGVTGYLTDDLLTALSDQYRVMDAFDRRMRAAGKDLTAPFWGFSIPMVSGPARRVGPKDGDQTTIIPMVTQIPVRAEEITVAYLNRHRISLELQQHMRDGLLNEAWDWSVKRSLEICGLQEEAAQEEADAQPVTVVAQEAVVVPATTITPVAPAALALPPASPDDPYISEPQVTWIQAQCGHNPGVIAAWCQRFQVPTLSHLRSSQFVSMYNLMSQDQ